ncbi:MAG: histidine phosphatase family protein [Candidatus Woesearchaeota archaeon]
MATKEIYLIRHGESYGNLELKADACTESDDSKLTDTGIRQAEALAIKLNEVHFDQIWSSDLARARDTAEIIVRGRNIKAIVKPELREIYRVIVGGPFKGARPKRKNEDIQRAEKVWTDINSFAGSRLCIICHGNIIRYFLAKHYKKDPKTMWELKIENCSITIIIAS